MLAPKVTFSCKGYFFQIVIKCKTVFAFSPPSLHVQSAPAGHIYMTNYTSS